MNIGAHVSAAGGVDQSPQRANEIGCECFQIFSRSPRGGAAPELTKEIIENFKAEMKKYQLTNFFIHTPYFINFASSKERVQFGSREVVRQELERGSKLGAKYVMTHLGASKDVGHDVAIKMTIEGLKKLLQGYKGSTELLIEMSAGTGSIIGSDFDDIAEIFKKVKHSKLTGICFDTAHMFESGYDFRTKTALNNTLKEFDKKIGIDKLKLLHVNDSKTKLGSKIDRHANIGEGELGIGAFEAIIADKRFKDIDFILETPGEENKVKDVIILKKIRDKKYATK